MEVRQTWTDLLNPFRKALYAAVHLLTGSPFELIVAMYPLDLRLQACATFIAPKGALVNNSWGQLSTARTLHFFNRIKFYGFRYRGGTPMTPQITSDFAKPQCQL
jgi:hypothetical protein